MKVIKGDFRVYNYSELSKEAKERAYNDYSDNPEFQEMVSGWEWRDAEETIKQFERVFDVEVHWNFELGNYCVRRIKFGNSWQNERLSGERLRRYIVNNFYDCITSPRTMYSRKSDYRVRRTSKISVERFNCPLTGVCYDNAILQPIFDFIDGRSHYDRGGCPCAYLIEDCFNSLFKDVQSSIEGYLSKEYFEEEIAMGTLYFKDGTVFNYPPNFTVLDEVEYNE